MPVFAQSTYVFQGQNGEQLLIDEPSAPASRIQWLLDNEPQNVSHAKHLLERRRVKNTEPSAGQATCVARFGQRACEAQREQQGQDQ